MYPSKSMSVYARGGMATGTSNCLLFGILCFWASAYFDPVSPYIGGLKYSFDHLQLLNGCPNLSTYLVSAQSAVSRNSILMSKNCRGNTLLIICNTCQDKVQFWPALADSGFFQLERGGERWRGQLMRLVPPGLVPHIRTTCQLCRKRTSWLSHPCRPLLDMHRTAITYAIPIGELLEQGGHGSLDFPFALG